MDLHNLLGGRPDCNPPQTISSSSSSSSSCSPTATPRQAEADCGSGSGNGRSPKKRRSPRKKSSTTYQQEVLAVMRHTSEARTKEEAARMAMLERIHDDKMQVVKSLIDVLKSIGNK